MTIVLETRSLHRPLLIATLLLALGALPGCGQEEEASREPTPAPEVVKRLDEKESELDTSDVRASDTAVGALINIPIEVIKINDFIYMATGLANTYLITTPEGNVLVDTGFAFQAKKQYKLLQEIDDRPVTHILLPQGQQDDIGGLKRWKDSDTKIIMTRTSMEYMPWRKKIGSWLLNRFAVLYNWSTQLLSVKDLVYPYKPITPDILVEDHEGYAFEQGGVRFEVLALPGAEGTNSTGLWLPDHKILFCGGGFVGPHFPMWPNLGTVRADRNRLVEPYLDSLNTVIALEPEIFLPGQEVAVFGKEDIKQRLVLIRDAVQYVHDEVIEGLNDGKDVYQLMQEIELPEDLAQLSQTHGRVDWTIRNMVYEYGGWFQYRHTSELYPYHVSEVYADVVEIAGVEPLLSKAQTRLQAGEPEHALLLIEMALEAEPENPAVLQAQIEVLTNLLETSRATTNNFSEIAWIETEITKAQEKLD